MNPMRRQRLLLVLFLVLGATAAVGVTLAALRENLNAFYPPAQIKDGSAPKDVRIRAGGMVKAGSIQRASDKLLVSFVLTDFAGSEFTVEYEGILPDLFGEGQGVMATGMLAADGHFKAQEVLAKHDENYHPPELAGIPKSAPVEPGAAAASPEAAQTGRSMQDAASMGDRTPFGTDAAPDAKPRTTTDTQPASKPPANKTTGNNTTGSKPTAAKATDMTQRQSAVGGAVTSKHQQTPANNSRGAHDA